MATRAGFEDIKVLDILMFSRCFVDKSVEIFVLELCPCVHFQVRRILHGAGSAWSQGGVPQHELLCPGEFLADGELDRPCQPAAVAGSHTPGQRGQRREGEESKH